MTPFAPREDLPLTQVAFEHSKMQWARIFRRLQTAPKGLGTIQKSANGIFFLHHPSGCFILDFFPLLLFAQKCSFLSSNMLAGQGL